MSLTAASESIAVMAMRTNFMINSGSGQDVLEGVIEITCLRPDIIFSLSNSTANNSRDNLE